MENYDWKYLDLDISIVGFYHELSKYLQNTLLYYVEL